MSFDPICILSSRCSDSEMGQLPRGQLSTELRTRKGNILLIVTVAIKWLGKVPLSSLTCSISLESSMSRRDFGRCLRSEQNVYMLSTR